MAAASLRCPSGRPRCGRSSSGGAPANRCVTETNHAAPIQRGQTRPSGWAIASPFNRVSCHARTRRVATTSISGERKPRMKPLRISARTPFCAMIAGSPRATRDRDSCAAPRERPGQTQAAPAPGSGPPPAAAPSARSRQRKASDGDMICQQQWNIYSGSGRVARSRGASSRRSVVDTASRDDQASGGPCGPVAPSRKVAYRTTRLMRILTVTEKTVIVSDRTQACVLMPGSSEDGQPTLAA